MASTMPDNFKNYSKEQQERLYLQFYSAYAINLTANPKEAKKQKYILASLAEAWGFTEHDVETLRITGDLSLATVRAMLDIGRLERSVQN